MKVKHVVKGFLLAAIFISLSVTSFSVQAKNGLVKHKTNYAAPAVAGWYFRAVSGYPAAISFEPVVLFKNGEYFEVGDEPLELLNVQASKSSRPLAWGKWRKTGSTFYLTNNKGKTYDYQLNSGNWFPAYAYSPAIKLKQAYEKVSGGDYGNGTNALVIKKLTFVDATHFTEGANGGITTASAKAWKKTSNAGTYRIYGNTIELTYGNKVVKKSFAIGAEGSPAHPSSSIIFIGGDAFTDTE
ncbi:hypothetical protein [Mucilaginibacter aquariorum]|uniref:Surface layer protein A domain-containing protein n=1 Tax=Mucilaginibacter aquariorum TaxID=2967225 RepID=A0ABT1T0S0_9SPHI|nr:hypothetical protein [Mucilaginibacter aquariorum]MCQ6958200.1 hypothetical protein [Mucilaginibacter aquariorum]